MNPRNIKDLAAAQQFCAGLCYVASLQRLPGLPHAGTGNRAQRFYAWVGTKMGTVFRGRSAARVGGFVFAPPIN
jgi:hypothetical protein